MKECLVDACCQLLHSMGGRIANPRMTAETMQLLCDRFSVRRFCMMPLYNAEEETVKHFLSRRRAAIEDLRPQLPKGLHTDILARVLLSPALYQTEDLDRLVVLKSRYLPIFLPLIPYAEWMEEEISYYDSTTAVERYICDLFQKEIVLTFDVDLLQQSMSYTFSFMDEEEMYFAYDVTIVSEVAKEVEIPSSSEACEVDLYAEGLPSEIEVYLEDCDFDTILSNFENAEFPNYILEELEEMFMILDTL
jgi:hypothetical protein